MKRATTVFTLSEENFISLFDEFFEEINFLLIWIYLQHTFSIVESPNFRPFNNFIGRISENILQSNDFLLCSQSSKKIIAHPRHDELVEPRFSQIILTSSEYHSHFGEFIVQEWFMMAMNVNRNKNNIKNEWMHRWKNVIEIEMKLGFRFGLH